MNYKRKNWKDFIDKLVYKLVARAKPQFITIEDLSISNMIEVEMLQLIYIILRNIV